LIESCLGAGVFSFGLIGSARTMSLSCEILHPMIMKVCTGKSKK